MKRAIFILTLVAAAAVAVSCTRDAMDGNADEWGGREAGSKSLTLRLGVEGLSTDNPAAATRGTIPAIDGEWEVNNLHLFFYDYAEDGGGAFVKHLDQTALGPAPVVMNGRYSINLADNDIPAGGDYTILAVANAAEGPGGENGYTDSEGIDGLIRRMSIVNERQAIETAAAYVEGVDVVETDNSRRISPAHLLMSARVVRRSADTEVEVRLKRTVARFEVSLHEDVIAAGYTLVSASVWSAATDTRIWNDRMTTAPGRMKRFYGMKKDSGDFTGNQIVSGLYAFENYVANPLPDDKVTTNVVIGLKLGGEDTRYYRINVARAGESQNLRRNHDYRIRINEVLGDGSDNEYTEYSAWSQAKNELLYTINEWNLDDNGMVITDGVNTMILPAKLVRFDPKGEVREFTIYTIGSAKLAISQESYPDKGFVSTLAGGTLLRVTAAPLPDTLALRQGSVELTYGGLRGTVSFVQAADNGLYLSLNRYEIPPHAPLGTGGIPDNVPISVTASGAWTATIYNMSPTTGNPGFSFTPGGQLQDVLKSSENPFGNLFQIYTTGPNTTDPAVKRNGFVMVTLDEDPANYSRVVVLAQSKPTRVTFKPALAGEATLRFSPVGIPTGLSGVAAAQGYSFEIDPGMADDDNYNKWDVVAVSGDHQYFHIEKIDVPYNANATIKPRFNIIAKGTSAGYPYNINKHMNLLSELRATFQVKYGTTTTDMVASTITLVQDPMNISVSTRGTNVPRVGGKIDDVTVNIDPSLHWIASIESEDQYAEHPAYLVLGDENMGSAITEGQMQATKLSVGFPKLYYPLVGLTPSVKVTVRLAENHDVYTVFTVTQDKLDPTAVPLNILDVRKTSWGSLTYEYDHYLTRYREYLTSPVLFGPSGKVKTGTVVITQPAPATIPDSYAIVHAGGQPVHYTQAVHNAINEWHSLYGQQRMLVYVSDNALNYIFNDASGATKRTTVLTDMGVEYKITSGAPGINTAASGTKLYQYIMNDGPFGVVDTQGTGWSYNSVSSTAKLSSLPPSAVPLIIDGGGGAFLFIDPEKHVMFLGESELFNITEATATALAAGNITNIGERQRSRFLANLQAWLLNAAQYGTNFTDMFLADPNSAAYKKVKTETGMTPRNLYNTAFGKPLEPEN